MAAIALAVPAAATAAKPPRELTFEVPVTQPDETGAPVSLATDVYLPRRRASRRGLPLIMLYHGGGSTKDNEFDSSRARWFARRGYVTLLYTARGHNGSGGQTTVAGPKEIRDLFDVAAWTLRTGGRKSPAHRSFRIDRRRIALWGFSQGGLHTNLGAAYSRDRALNPYRIRFRAIAPANTPDHVFEALVDRGAVKLTYGAGLLATYGPNNAKVSPTVEKWIATAAADDPGLYGAGGICDARGHDTATSSMKADLAARSVGCMLGRVRAPTLWAQSFDDGLFTPEMAIRAWRKLPRRRDDRLILFMAGHGAPAGLDSIQRRVFRAQLAFFNHELRGRRLRLPRVLYWTRDPNVAVPNDAYAYPRRAWLARRAPRWPPPGTRPTAYLLGADGRARTASAAQGTLPLAPYSLDTASDPVAKSALSATPVGTSPLPAALAAPSSPGLVASFETPAFRRTRELSGTPHASVDWTPAGTDSQLVLKLFDRAPDGTLTLLSRGVAGIRGAAAGQELRVKLRGNATSALVRRGHSLLAWITASDLFFYKPYPGQAAGSLGVGPAAKLTLPLR